MRIAGNGADDEALWGRGRGDPGFGVGFGHVGMMSLAVNTHVFGR